VSTVTPTPPTTRGTDQDHAKKISGDGIYPPSQLAASPLRAPSSNAVAYIRILFGVLFLIATIVPLGCGVFLFGIGLAFVLALALATTTAASVVPLVGTVAWPGAFGDPLATVGQTATLSAPIVAGQTLRITNSIGGRTRVIAGSAGQVRAQVTRPVGWGPPAVVGLTRLTVRSRWRPGGPARGPSSGGAVMPHDHCGGPLNQTMGPVAELLRFAGENARV
jgi:hypothetical protein